MKWENGFKHVERRTYACWRELGAARRNVESYRGLEVKEGRDRWGDSKLVTCAWEGNKARRFTTKEEGEEWRMQGWGECRQGWRVARKRKAGTLVRLEVKRRGRGGLIYAKSDGEEAERFTRNPEGGGCEVWGGEGFDERAKQGGRKYVPMIPSCESSLSSSIAITEGRINWTKGIRTFWIHNYVYYLPLGPDGRGTT